MDRARATALLEEPVVAATTSGTGGSPPRADGTARLRNVALDPDSGCRFRSVFTSLAERFWSHVQRGEGCWTWQAARSRDGYGKFQLRRRVVARAHRVAWMLAHGEIPAGQVVRHDCDNPLCVRPDHLRLGSQRENVGDQLARGRFVLGSRNGMAKLHERDALAIRRRVTAGESHTALAAEFRVSLSAVGAIVAGHTWAHVQDAAVSRG